MVEKLSQDIANTLSVKLDEEINPIRTTAENISTRLSEIETVFFPKSLSKDTLTSLLSKKAELDVIFSKIDNLEMLVGDLKANLDTLEEQVKEAEIDLNIPSQNVGIFNRLNNILSPRSSVVSNKTLLSSKPNYQGAEICKTEKYFESN